METAIKETIKEEKGATMTEEKKGKRKWLRSVLNFLMYGGWILVIAAVLAVIILFSS